jgi:hypothetical protein
MIKYPHIGYILLKMAMSIGEASINLSRTENFVEKHINSKIGNMTSPEDIVAIAKFVFWFLHF